MRRSISSKDEFKDGQSCNGRKSQYEKDVQSAVFSPVSVMMQLATVIRTVTITISDRISAEFAVVVLRKFHDFRISSKYKIDLINEIEREGVWGILALNAQDVRFLTIGRTPTMNTKILPTRHRYVPMP